MMFELGYDSRTQAFLEKLNLLEDAWNEMFLRQTMHDIAKAAEEHIKPLTHVRPNYTGNLERSIRSEARETSDGFNIDFYGLDYGMFMDDGNFPSSDVLYTPRGLATEFFPIDSRFGLSPPIKSQFIHGMGSQNSDAPTHFSEKTAEWLQEGEAANILSKHMDDFLNWVVAI